MTTDPLFDMNVISISDHEQTHDAEESDNDEDDTIDGEKEAKVTFDQSLPSSHTVNISYIFIRFLALSCKNLSIPE